MGDLSKINARLDEFNEKIDELCNPLLMPPDFDIPELGKSTPIADHVFKVNAPKAIRERSTIIPPLIQGL